MKRDSSMQRSRAVLHPRRSIAATRDEGWIAETIAIAEGEDNVTTSWRSWRLFSRGLGAAGVSVGVGAAEQRQAVPQQHVLSETHERSVERPLQHDLVCCLEQQVDFGFEARHDLTTDFEQHRRDAA